MGKRAIGVFDSGVGGLTVLKELKKEMQDVHGSKCEVYSRVVGYLRPVQNWNKGKKEEFAMRKTMHVDCGCGCGK